MVKDYVLKAKEEGKILWFRYGDVYFTPERLATLQAQGKYLWGAGNFVQLTKDEVIERCADDIYHAMDKFANVLTNEELMKAFEMAIDMAKKAGMLKEEMQK